MARASLQCLLVLILMRLAITIKKVDDLAINVARQCRATGFLL